MTKTQNTIIVASLVVLALAGTAVGSSYFTRSAMEEPHAPPPAQQAQALRPAAAARPQVAAAQPPCNDHNAVGTVGGAVAGGLLGNQFGKGTGKTVATVGGVAAGGYLGNKYIPTNGTLCR